CLKLVTVRSQSNQEMRALLGMREHLVKQKIDLENHISGILKPFGLIVGRGNVAPDMFRERVIDALRIADAHGVRIGAMVVPPLDLYRSACHQLAILSAQVEAGVAANQICKSLMTPPAGGPLRA